MRSRREGDDPLASFISLPSSITSSCPSHLHHRRTREPKGKEGPRTGVMPGTEQLPGANEGDGASSEEEDFLSDSFLAGAKEKTDKGGGETYSEKRRRQLNAGRDRTRLQNRAEREKEARAMGLSRNLLSGISSTTKRALEDQQTGETEQSNKALKMMMAMGYKHGKGLGREESAEKAEEGSDERQSKVLTEPLAIDERWMGAKARAGIGKLSAQSAQALSRDISRATSKEAIAKSTVTEEERFRQRTSDEQVVRHSERLLVDARSTCENLDGRLGVKFSPLWLNPESLAKTADQLPPHVAELVEYAFEGLDDTSEDGDEQREALARAQECKQFCQLPSKARLEITLSHLRRAHYYCLYCGLKYESQSDLDEQCPGEDEDDH